MGKCHLNSGGQYMAVKDANASEDSNVPVLILAASTGDGVKATGQTVDRKSGTALAMSAVIATGWFVDLTDTKSLSFAIEIQESANDSDWDAAEVIQAATVAQLAVATTAYRGVVENSLDLMDRQRYFRINVTPELSAASADELTYHTTAILTGYNQIPQ